MGQNLSNSQKIEITNNGKWIHLIKAKAYINISSICYFQVISDPGGVYMIFKTVDNTNKNNEYSSIDTITTDYMKVHELEQIVSVLTK
jgi:hypothetical protein